MTLVWFGGLQNTPIVVDFDQGKNTKNKIFNFLAIKKSCVVVQIVPNIANSATIVSISVIPAIAVLVSYWQCILFHYFLKVSCLMFICRKCKPFL